MCGTILFFIFGFWRHTTRQDICISACKVLYRIFTAVVTQLTAGAVPQSVGQVDTLSFAPLPVPRRARPPGARVSSVTTLLSDQAYTVRFTQGQSHSTPTPHATPILLSLHEGRRQYPVE